MAATEASVLRRRSRSAEGRAGRASAGGRWSASRVEVEAPTPARPSSPRGWPRTAGSAGSSPTAGFALAGLGVAHEAASRGEARFADVAAECLRTAGDAVVDEPRRAAGGRRAGLAGRLRLRPRGRRLARPGPRCRRARWCCRSSRSAAAGTRPSSPSTPSSSPATTPRSERRRSAPGWPGCAREASLPLLDPHPTSHAEIRSVRPPGDFEDAVAGGDSADRRGRDEQGRARPRGRRQRRRRPRPGGAVRRHARAVPVLLLLLLRHAGGGLHRRQPGAAGAPLGRERLDRRPRRLDPAQLRPRGRRPPRRAAAAQRQGPPRAAHRRRADRPRPAPARGLGRGRRRSRRSSRWRTSSTWRRR